MPESPDAGPRAPDASPLPSDGGGGDDASSPDAGPPDAGPGESATYARVAEEIFAERCTGCHNGTARGRDPVLEPAVAHGVLVGRSSDRVPEVSLVEPGAPERSFLYRKLAGTHLDLCTEHGVAPDDCGDRMPRGLGAVPLTEAELALVRDWIAAGAPR